MAKNPNEPNQPQQDTEFAEDQAPEVNPSEQKDARGGNHNPEGANQYTSGRVDDRGRKADQQQRENKGRE